MLMIKGELQKALDVLKTANPPMETDTDLLRDESSITTTIGTIYRIGTTVWTIGHVQPANAVWWMGLGIAMEKTGHKGAAVQAYRKATESGSLNPQLQLYVEGRMKVWGG